MKNKKELKKIENESRENFKHNQMIIATQKRTIQFGEWSNVGLAKDGFHFIIHDILQSEALEFEIKELEPLIKALQILYEGIE